VTTHHPYSLCQVFPDTDFEAVNEVDKEIMTQLLLLEDLV